MTDRYPVQLPCPYSAFSTAEQGRLIPCATIPSGRRHDGALFYARGAESMGTSNGRQHTSVVVYTRPEATKPPSATQESKAHEVVTRPVTGEQIPATGNNTIDSVGTTDRWPSTDDPIPDKSKSNGIPPSLIPITTHRGINRKVPIRHIDRTATGLDQRRPGLTFAMASHMNPLVRTASEESMRGDAPSARPGSHFTQPLRLSVRLLRFDHSGPERNSGGGCRPRTPANVKPRQGRLIHLIRTLATRAPPTAASGRTGPTTARSSSAASHPYH